ncbi:MAG: Ig-like domain-containing protein [Gemmatimonadales bacterium]
MVSHFLCALLAWQPPAQQLGASDLQQPIARVDVRPAEFALQVGDTVRLWATAYDSAGGHMPGAVVHWFTAGGRFEGTVDSTGLVTAGATGTLNVAAVATVPGRAVKSTVGFGRITVLPLPPVTIVVTPKPERMLAGTSLVLEAVPFAANGDRRYDRVTWKSTRPGVVEVSALGRVAARAVGRATITATVGKASASWTVTVVPNTIARATVAPAAASVRAGDVVRFALIATDAGRRPLAAARAEWAVSPVGQGHATIDRDGVFVADQPGTYRVVAMLGARVAEAFVQVAPRNGTRQVTIVGRLPLKGFLAAELWIHPDGKHAYLSTIADRIYAIDISDPAKPFITDSVVVDARVVNDVMTTEDGRYGVMTREGASTRKNGIVILSFEDPAHPKPIAEFTETVTGGVHSTYVYQGYVYLTDDATGSMRVIDIRDPYRPKQVARWQVERPEAGRTLHDIDVRDGLATLSYWNDGLVILDVGNGIKGGSPENPRLVMQYKYDLNELYKKVELAGGPGFIRGTHTSWRYKNWVFVGDEVFPARQPGGGPGVIGLGRAYGRLHVIDISDLANPREVAWFEPEDGGAHNVWIAGDTLYLGDYQGGLRVVDISGELRGDLLAQGREYAHVHTGDASGYVANVANAWGAIYRDGLVYVPDMNSGLWVVKVEPPQHIIP